MKTEYDFSNAIKNPYIANKDKHDIVITKDKDGYFAYVSSLKGCVSQGDTYEEALSNIKEAMELYLESLNL